MSGSGFPIELNILPPPLCRSQDFPKTNDHLLERIRQYIESCSNSPGGSVYLETAGGVHSPSLHAPLTQIDSLRPLRLPTLLVASPHLGGISTTLSSYESLITRGYTIDGVLGLRDEYYRNHEFLRDYFAERGIDFWSFDKPHSKAELSIEEDVSKLDWWYSQIEDGNVGKGDSMVEVVAKLEQKHQARIDELKSMPARTHKSIWWPFTQHGIVSPRGFDCFFLQSDSSQCCSRRSTRTRTSWSLTRPRATHSTHTTNQRRTANRYLTPKACSSRCSMEVRVGSREFEVVIFLDAI